MTITKEQTALMQEIYETQHSSVDPNAPPPPAGFIWALLGTGVKNKDNKDKLVDYVFATQVNGGGVVSISNLEVLVPVELDAARKAAANASTNRVTVLHNGEYVDYPLQGEVAAIVTAYYLFLEGLRARLRSGKYTEEQIRLDAAATTSFVLPDPTRREVSEDDVKAALAGDDPMAALRALGINIKPSAKEGAK